MSRIAKPILRGLILPFKRAAWWAAQSGEYSSGGTRLGALKSADPAPGEPVAQGPTALLMQSSGTQAWNKSLQVATQAPGLPSEGATVRWRYDGDTSWRGWDPPTSISHWEPIVWSSSATWAHPHALTLEDETVLVVAQSGNASRTATCWIRNPLTGVWSSATVTGAGGAYDLYPCLVAVPLGDGRTRVCCYYWREDTGTANVAFSYSDDSGATWVRGGTAVLTTGEDSTSADFTIRDGWPTDLTTGWAHRRLRVAYKDGQWLMLASLRDNDSGAAVREFLVQYASVDGGTFQEVWRTDDALNSTAGVCPDICTQNGQFVVGWIVASSGIAAAFQLGSAYEAPPSSFSQIDADIWATTSGVILTDADFVLVAAPEGDRIHAMGRVVADQAWATFRSADSGATWAPMGLSAVGTENAASWWNGADTGTYPADACATWVQGRMLVVHGHASNPGIYDESLSASYLGGPTTVTMPPISPIAVDSKRASYQRTWLPFDLPDDVGFSASVTGTPTASIATGALALTTGVAEARWHDITPSGTIGHGVIVEHALGASAGTAELKVRHYEAGEGYEVRVAVSSTAVSVYDAVGASLLGTSTVSGVQAVKVALQNASVRVWTRSWSSDSDREWTLVASVTNLTDDAGGTFTTSRIRFGSPASSTSTFHFLGKVDDAGGADNFVGSNLLDFNNPDDLLGRTLTALPTYLDGGTRVSALSGPTFGGEEWAIDTVYGYPVDALLPTAEPSPRRGWRSADITDFDASCTELRLAWRLDDDGLGDWLNEDVGLANDLLAAYLDGLNCGQVRLDLYYGGAWHTGPTTQGDAFTAVRKGSSLRPSSSSTGGVWRFGEAVDALVAFYSGSPSAVDWTGRISANTEGTTKSSTGTTKYPTFEIAEPDSASSTTPNAVIWPTRQVLVVHPSGFSRDVKGFRFVIPVGASTDLPGRPPEGYYEIAKLAVGTALVFGHDYALGREVESSDGVELVEARDRSRRSRVRGPTRRKVSFDWSSGVYLADWRTEDAPDYITGSANSGAAAVAFRYDTPILLQDWLAADDGAHRLVVYLPYLPYDSSATSAGDSATLWRGRAAGAVYGRVVGPVRVRHELGDEEGLDELVSMATVTLEEEL